MAKEGSEQQSVDTSSEVAEKMFTDIKSTLPDAIAPIWESLESNPWLLAALVIVIGFVLAKLFQWLFKSVLGKIANKTTGQFDDKLFVILSRAVYSLIFYLSLLLAIEALQFSQGVDTFLKRFVVTLLILSLIGKLLKITRITLEAFSHNKHRFKFIEERTIPILDITTKILIVGAGLYVLFLSWGINPTAWLASAGIIGIAVGFAAKDTLANLFSGFFIVADSPYKLGDYILLDTGERGRVTHVGIRSTRLLTRDDVEVTIPNSVMGNAKIVNESGGPWEKTRIRINVGVSYDSDLEQVHDVLLEMANDNDDLCKNPEPRVRFRAFGASSIDLQLMAWIERPEQKGLISHRLIMNIHKLFNENGIEIPYSKQDLYVKEWPDNHFTDS
ncbi:mechanosensitive ion channel family protein [Kangiella sediminilitoris]|uniref:Small-conductance mechanosensitive channel n=1 Tax=Kangiella sediminilitoris TaxID=1144748 RepID=A0A1B3BB48_9GAMM|nr:mechanosensitive ion channel family protein [Kangiella sediminilitoris]AOE49996.1 MscS Mechanosensitive ion channel [Kangiella sediminilitoris]